MVEATAEEGSWDEGEDKDEVAMAGLELLVRVDEVGTVVVVGRVDFLRVVGEERVVEVIMRSMCEARLSEEGLRERSFFCGGFGRVERSGSRSGSVCWIGGGYWCF